MLIAIRFWFLLQLITVSLQCCSKHQRKTQRMAVSCRQTHSLMFLYDMPSSGLNSIVCARRHEKIFTHRNAKKMSFSSALKFQIFRRTSQRVRVHTKSLPVLIFSLLVNYFSLLIAIATNTITTFAFIFYILTECSFY